MGIGSGYKYRRSSSCFDSPTGNQPELSSLNPDPTRFVIKKQEVVNEYLIVEIQYLDCTNYEGLKVLLFEKRVTVSDLLKQKVVDPHFSNNPDYISPIARFEPTAKGWNMAKLLCEVL